MKQLFATAIILLPLLGFSQNSEPLSIAQYRDIYSAAQLIESAKACELDWQPYYEAFLNKQKQLATEQNLSLENHARMELELRNTRERLAKSLSPDCSDKQRDSLAIRLEVERERLIAEENPDDENWVLKPRGRNWIYIHQIQPNHRKNFVSGKTLDEQKEEWLFRIADNWGVNGKVNWVEYPKGAEKQFTRPWQVNGSESNITGFFLNMRPYFYLDEDMSALAAHAENIHPLLKKAADLERRLKIGEARDVLESLQEDSFVKNQPEYWILRANLEKLSGSRFRAREYLRFLGSVRPRNARTELLMRSLLISLGEEHDKHWAAHFLGLVVEMNLDGEIVVLSMYRDGQVVLAYGTGGGVIIQSFVNQSLIWDVQLMGRSLIMHKNPFEIAPLGISTSGKLSRNLPEKDLLRLTFLNGEFRTTAEYDVDELQNRKSSFWLTLQRLFDILDTIYQRAEVER